EQRLRVPQLRLPRRRLSRPGPRRRTEPLVVSRRPPAVRIPHTPLRRRRLAQPPPLCAAARLPVGAVGRRLPSGGGRDRHHRVDPAEPVRRIGGRRPAARRPAAVHSTLAPESLTTLAHLVISARW